MTIFFKALLNLLISITFGILFFILCLLNTLPEIQLVESMQRKFYIKIYDNKGNFIAKYGHWHEKTIDASTLPPHLINALTSAEDKNFFKHFGFDWLAMLRSGLLNIINKKIVSGGSSITQQLAKNLLQNETGLQIGDKTILRKIKELLLSIKLEIKYTKYEILTLYLNRCYFGADCYGIYSASLFYFNKPPHQLNLYESAALIGLLKAPSKLIRKEISWKKRTKKILNLMLKNKQITEAAFLSFDKFVLPTRTNFTKVGYFTDYVISQIPQQFRNRDLAIYTTLDLEIQQAAAEAVKETFDAYAADWTADQGAMVVLDKSGAILAIIGGIDYNDSQFNCATQANRSAGSFFKYYIFLYAMQLGLDPDSYMNDEQIAMGSWTPSNYLHKTIGRIKIRDAFAFSVNSCAIILLIACGINNVINLAKKLGIKKTIEQNPSIAIGGMNASILELASTMIPIINNGYATESHCIKEIRDAKTNELLYRHEPKLTLIFDSRTVYYMWELMKGVCTYGIARLLATLPIATGGKTGTSNLYKDLLFGCVTETGLVIMSWYGRKDCKPMILAPGKRLPIIAVYKFLKKISHTGTAPMQLPKPNNSNKLTLEDLLVSNDD